MKSAAFSECARYPGLPLECLRVSGLTCPLLPSVPSFTQPHSRGAHPVPSPRGALGDSTSTVPTSGELPGPTGREMLNSGRVSRAGQRCVYTVQARARKASRCGQRQTEWRTLRGLLASPSKASPRTEQQKNPILDRPVRSVC